MLRQAIIGKGRDLAFQVFELVFRIDYLERFAPSPIHHLGMAIYRFKKGTNTRQNFGKRV